MGNELRRALRLDRTGGLLKTALRAGLMLTAATLVTGVVLAPAHAREIELAAGRSMLSGSAPNAMMVDQALTVAKQFGADVINAVKVAAPQQVMLEVRFVEASRSASRELGVNWQVLGTTLASGGTGVGAAVGASTLISGSAPFGSIVGKLLGSGVQADGLLQAL